MFKVLAGTSLLALSVATAAADAKKVLPGAQHTPALFVDESSTLLTIRPVYPGWGVRVQASIVGFADGDHARVEIKQGGKVVDTVKCMYEVRGEPKRGNMSCEGEKALSVKGAFEADLIAVDDKTDQPYLVRTYKFNVAQWTLFPAKEKGYGMLVDDLLGAAYANHDTNANNPEFIFWMYAQKVGDGALRCSVDGKALEPFKVFFDTVHGGSEAIQQEDRTAKGDTVRYYIQHVKLEVRDLYWGTDDELKAAHQTPSDKLRRTITNPGRWTCDVRVEQKTVRQLAFTVDANGRIVGDEMNTGKRAVPTLPMTPMIEIRIPKDAGIDERVRPAALKQSIGWGLPWPDHPKVKTLQDALPPQSGKLPEPS